MNSYFSTRIWAAALIAKKGDFAASENLGFGNYQTNLSGRGGSRDYLFDHYYLGRSASDGFLSRQLFMDQGQFKFAPINLLSSNILAASINLRADFPSKWIPIKLYADIGLIYTNDIFSEGNALIALQVGAMLSLFNEAFEVYFPFFSSSDIKDFYELNAPNYKQRITFSLDLNKLNPHKLVKALEF